MDTKDIYDEVSALKDIADRERMIRSYRCTGVLDRAEAINKIKELRFKDSTVAAVTISKVAVNPMPLDCASDEALVGELDMQMRVLAAKVIAKKGEN